MIKWTKQQPYIQHLSLDKWELETGMFWRSPTCISFTQMFFDTKSLNGILFTLNKKYFVTEGDVNAGKRAI